jgi:hypothetical protein
MIEKHLIRPERLRRIPPSFSWIDHRIIRHRRLEGCHHGAWALYLFLASVADERGLSYYSEAALQQRLKMNPLQLADARRQLAQADLIAYGKPLYQVLELTRELPAPTVAPVQRSERLRPVSDILRHLLQGGVA